MSFTEIVNATLFVYITAITYVYVSYNNCNYYVSYIAAVTHLYSLIIIVMLMYHI